MRRFLNRLLGLPIARQNLLFNYFTATLTACIRSAKAEGRYSEGMSDMPASDISQEGLPETLWTDPHTGLKTLQNTLRVDRGISYTVAVERLERERRTGDASGFYVSKREVFGRTLVMLATAKPGSSQMFSICRPNTGTYLLLLHVRNRSCGRMCTHSYVIRLWHIGRTGWHCMNLVCHNL